MKVPTLKHIVHKILPVLVLILMALLWPIPQATGQDKNPDPPVIDSVSVVKGENGAYHTVIGWQAYDWSGYDVDSSFFIVGDYVDSNNKGYIYFDTIRKPSAISYKDTRSQPDNEFYTYGLKAVGVIHGITLDSPISDPGIQSMLLTVQSVDTCEGNVVLSWNSYYRDQQPNSNYKVYARSDSDSRIVTNINDTAYTFENLNTNETYTFKVRIIGDGFTSTSNPVSQYISSPAIPDRPEIDQITTSAGFENTLIVSIDQQNTAFLRVLQSDSYNGFYDTIYLDSTNLTSEYVYENNESTSHVSYYCVQATNFCDGEPVISDTLNTIILNATDEHDYINITGNGIESAEADYTLLRIANGETKYFNAGQPPVNYKDYQIFDMKLRSAEVTYKLIANVGDSVTIQSNPKTITIKDELLWPNTIIAGKAGIDGIFKPYVQRTYPDRYNLKIYNKWGMLVFESSNVDEGWNGKYNGKYAMQGAYLYIATYKFTSCSTKTVRGTLTVIH